jgi:hypothetical protein
MYFEVRFDSTTKFSPNEVKITAAGNFSSHYFSLPCFLIVRVATIEIQLFNTHRFAVFVLRLLETKTFIRINCKII